MSSYISLFTLGVIFIEPIKMKKKPSSKDSAANGKDFIIY
jgi:hypothetical protein